MGDGAFENNRITTSADGTPDFVLDRTYDENGHQTGETVDLDGDEEIDLTVTNETDDDGNVTRTEWETDDDEDAELVSTAEFDDAGNQTLYTQDGTGANAVVVVEAEGVVDTRVVSTYDAEGRLLTREVDGEISPEAEVVEPADGMADSRIEWTYDENGNLTSIATDSDGDGEVDPSGMATWTCWDVDADQVCRAPSHRWPS